jgi:hypothetical protein
MRCGRGLLAMAGSHRLTSTVGDMAAVRLGARSSTGGWRGTDARPAAATAPGAGLVGVPGVVGQH